MKPVTDPALLSQLESQSGGPAAPVNSGPVTDPALLAQLEGGDKPQIGLVQGGVGGLEHGLHRASRGLLKTAEFMAGQPISNQVKKLHGWAVSKGMPSMAPTDEMMAKEEQFVKDAPWTANVGQVMGEAIPETAATFLGMPAAEKVAGAFLPKAAQKLAPAVADIGANTAAAATFAPENKGEAAAWAAGGSTAGRALPHAIDYARKGASKVADFVVPSRSAAGKISHHLGAEEFAQTGEAVREGLKKTGGLPQTTAGLSDNAKMAGLERGAQGRGLVDLGKTREAQEAAKKSALTKLTSSADEVDTLAKEADRVTEEGVERLRKMPLGKERKAGVVAELESLKTTDEVIGSPVLQGAIKRAQSAINDPNSSTLVLTELRRNLPKGKEYDKVRDVLMNAANERSKFIASAAEEGAGAIKGQAQAAQASKGLRGEYLDEAGGKLKDINELSLNKSLTKPGLDEGVVKSGRELSDEVRRTNLYKTSEAPTELKKHWTSVLSTDPLGAAVGTFLSGGKMAPVYGALRVRDHLVKKAVDTAVADPKEFLRMFDAKKATGEALAVWEKKLARTLRAATMAGSQAGQAIGEQNAP